MIGHARDSSNPRVMPPRGGRPDLSDQSVKNAVDYMTKAVL
jgi:cytochrome c5